MSIRIPTLAFALSAALVCAVAAQEAGEWVSLFDGKTLEGWTQLNGTATYEVQDGAIVGTTAAGSPNSFLCTNKQYGDFELEFEVKCDKGLNSGVQIRSRQKGPQGVAADTAKAATGAPVEAKGAEGSAPDAPKKAKKAKNSQEGRVFGPQVEIECGPGQAGFVYGEATSFAWLSPEPKSKDKSVSTHDHFKNDDWNHYRVIAKGPRIQTFVNGQPVADLTHEEIYKTHPSGFVGLQVHSIGKRADKFHVAWRNLRIRELK